MTSAAATSGACALRSALMQFSDTATDKEARFSIGQELESGRCYLSIPVANEYVDYEEFYEITKLAHDLYPRNSAELSAFAEGCRRREHDELLMQEPGRLRGIG